MSPYIANDNDGTRSDEAEDVPGIDGMATTAVRSCSVPASDHAVDTEFLIVGAGPAGAALACFLGSHGMHLYRYGCRYLVLNL
jgi:hypothetical protein